MTQNEIDLLSKDLCERLPYGVKIETEYFTKATLVAIRKNISYGARKDLLVTYDISGEETPYQSEERSDTISKIKPYLLPLSSMTEDQKEEFNSYFASIPYYGDNVHIPYYSVESLIEFYNKHHLDWRGLIPKGLANDATGKNIY